VTTETKELTTIERAEQALGLATLRPQLEALVKKSANIQTITNKAGRDECHSALMTLKNQRVAIEKTGKEARDEATRYSKAVIAAEKTLVEILTPEETRLAALRQEWDDAREAEKREAERLEREAQQKQQDAIAEIAAVPGRLWGASVPEIEQALQELAGWDMAVFDDVFSPSAAAARDAAIADLKVARDKRQALDDEAEAIKAAQEELERQRKQLEAEQAAARKAQEEADRKAAEARAEADRLAQAERDRLAAEAKAEQDRIAAEQAARQAELDAQAAEQARASAEAAKKAATEAAERARVEAEEQAARDAQAAQEAAEREAEAIRTATLYDAAAEALALLLSLGQGDHLTCKKLRAAINREPQG
jgi:hypothetical protein